MAATSKTTQGKSASGARKSAAKKASKPASKAKAATKPTADSSKGRSSKSGSSSATGASKTANRSAAGASKKSTANASTAGSKKATPKSGAAGKRTASGGAKKSSGSTGSAKPQASSGSKAAAAKRSPKSAGGGSRSAKSAKSSGTARKGIVSRVAEAVGGLLAGGQRDVLDLLKEDHRRVDGYFQKVKAAEDGNHEAVFKKIKAELDLHAHVEEAIFYPHLMEAGSEELKKIVREGVEEHAQVKTLLTELSELKGTDKVFKAKLKVLIENVEHHVEEEEDEMFPLVDDELSEETLVKLAEQIEKEKAKVSGTKPKSRAASAKKG